jgi:hypothetical protein
MAGTQHARSVVGLGRWPASSISAASIGSSTRSFLRFSPNAVHLSQRNELDCPRGAAILAASLPPAGFRTGWWAEVAERNKSPLEAGLPARCRPHVVVTGQSPKTDKHPCNNCRHASPPPRGIMEASAAAAVLRRQLLWCSTLGLSSSGVEPDVLKFIMTWFDLTTPSNFLGDCFCFMDTTDEGLTLASFSPHCWESEA